MEHDTPDIEISESSLAGDAPPQNPLTRRPTPRRRALQTAVLIGVIVIGIIGVRGPISAFIAASHTQPGTRLSTPAPHAGIQTNVSYGALTVNGKPTPFIVGAQDYPEAVPLRPGMNTLVLQAPPFNPITCVIDAAHPPAAPSPFDRCGVTQNDNLVSSVNMVFLPSDLPPLARQQFAAYIQQHLNHFQTIHATVAANTHYAGGYRADNTPIVVEAQAPIAMHLLAEAHDFGDDTPICYGAFCAFTPLTLPQTPGAIPRFVSLTYGVEFRWQNDALATPLQPDFPDHSACDAQDACFIPFSWVPLTLIYNSTSGWADFIDPEYTPGVTAQQDVTTFTVSSCENAESLISYLYQTQHGSTDYLAMGATHTSPAGCLFAEVPQNTGNGPGDLTTNPLTDTTKAWFLEHFGAVMAVNDVARAQFPKLPSATTTEVDETLSNGQHS